MSNAVVNKIKGYVERGIEMSKSAAGKVCEGVGDFGQQSTLHLEINSLKSKKKRLISKLGDVVYEDFTVKMLDEVKANDDAISTILKELSTVNDEINSRSRELKDINHKSASANKDNNDVR